VIGKDEAGDAHFYITYKNRNIHEFLGVYGGSLQEARNMNAFELRQLIKGGFGQILYEARDNDETNRVNSYMVFDMNGTRGEVREITPQCDDGVLENRYLIKDVNGDGDSEILEILSPFDDMKEKLNGKIPRSYLAFSYDRVKKVFVPSGNMCKEFFLKDAPMLKKRKAGYELYEVLLAALPYWSMCDNENAWKVFDDNYLGDNKEEVRNEINGFLHKACFGCVK